MPNNNCFNENKAAKALPLLDFCSLQVFAQSMEVVSLPLELGRGVDLVGHDTSDGLLDILHPLGHLLVAHVVDILDEMVVLLPERHLQAGLLLSPGVIGMMSICQEIPDTLKLQICPRYQVTI